MQFFHSSPVGAHLGIEKTSNRLRSKYYWPNMNVHIKAFVLSCRDCQQFKPSNQPPVGHMSDYSRMYKPGAMHSLDIVGPLPTSTKQNKFIAVFVDVASKWVIAVPMRSATSKTLIKALTEHVIFQLGTPGILLVDNGSPFISREFMTTCSKFNIKLHHAPKYAPFTNMVERYNRTIKTSLAIFARESHRVWDSYLQYVVFALRSSVSEATGYTPAMLTLGRELRSPYELYNESKGPGKSLMQRFMLQVSNMI